MWLGNATRDRVRWRASVHGVRVACAIVQAAALSSCTSARIGLDHVDPPVAYRENTASALSGLALGNATATTLRRYGLSELWERDRGACIARLHQMVAAGAGGRDELFALAELSFLHGKRLVRDRPPRQPLKFGKYWRRSRRAADEPPAAVPDAARAHFLAAAIYAYAFLFPEIRNEHVGALDTRLRLAADLYEAALAYAFADHQPGGLTIAGGDYALPFGSIAIAFDESELQWGQRTLADFRWSGSFSIAGLRNHYRKPGVGVAVAARTKLPEDDFDFIASTAWVPATVFLRLAQPRRQLRTTSLDGRLEIHTADESQSTTVAGREFALQTDASAALAATLEQSRFWEYELARFLGRAIGVAGAGALTAQEPYVAGKIPAVFVHGTDSSPATWANMVNDLQYDQRIHNRFHFWFFRYDSGNPILYSSMLLRRALSNAVAELGEEGRPNCLGDMIVLGHSQGGLLTKLTAVDTGAALWNAQYRKPLDEVRLRRRARELLREMTFLEPLPFVRRLVFIATPHRGSYLASSQLVRRLASRLIRLPGDVLEISTDVAGLGRYSRPGVTADRLPTSIDNMSPGNTFIKASSKLSIADQVPYHSIIPLLPGESEEEGGDGVVKFASAELAGAASQLVVPTGHTTLSDARTIEEVRRILLLHAEAAPCRRRPIDG